MTDEDKVEKMCELFNSMMPDRLHIGIVSEWKPEHSPNAYWDKIKNTWVDRKDKK